LLPLIERFTTMLAELPALPILSGPSENEGSRETPHNERLGRLAVEAIKVVHPRLGCATGVAKPTSAGRRSPCRHSDISFVVGIR
jgi:hypothetical protein